MLPAPPAAHRISPGIHAGGVYGGGKSGRRAIQLGGTFVIGSGGDANDEHGDVRDEHGDARDEHGDIRDEHGDVQAGDRAPMDEIFAALGG